jgi:hypothetical protein
MPGSSNSLLPLGFPTKILYAPLLSRIRDTHTHTHTHTHIHAYILVESQIKCGTRVQ